MTIVGIKGLTFLHMSSQSQTALTALHQQR